MRQLTVPGACNGAIHVVAKRGGLRRVEPPFTSTAPASTFRSVLLQPITLQGEHVRLEPLSMSHHGDLCAAGLDEDLWRWTTSHVTTPDEMRAYIETALKGQAEGTALPFAIVSRETGKGIGSTRYGNVDLANRRLEIGWTWLGRVWQRTAANTEAKYLLLQHAFERLECLRVEFKTDSLNERSRAALLRIDAKEEGTLRNHMVTWSGRIRHSVYYSVIDVEWPAVKAALENKLKRDVQVSSERFSGGGR